MQEGLHSLWMRLSIVEAKIQQERSRLKTDPVRLALLDQMKCALEEDIRDAELGGLRPSVCTGVVEPDFEPRPAA